MPVLPAVKITRIPARDLSHLPEFNSRDVPPFELTVDPIQATNPHVIEWAKGSNRVVNVVPAAVDQQQRVR